MSANKSKKIAIIGAGPGGLCSAMILAEKGFDVHVYEKNDFVGGRNAEIKMGDFSFDTGPTFLHMDFIIREMFKQAGENADDYIEMVSLDPLNRIIFEGESEEDKIVIDGSSDNEKMYQQIKKKFPKDSDGYLRFMKDNQKKNKVIFNCLEKPYHKITSLISLNLLKAAKYVFRFKTVQDDLEKYFQSRKLQMAFSFQTKYLGMAAWKCPSFFSIMAYWEYAFGIFHVQGGLCKLSHAMAEVFKKKGGKIHFNSPVEEILVDKKNRATGIRLENQEVINFDKVIVNADAPYALTNLLGSKNIPKQKMRKKKFSCSTYMLYLCVDKLYDVPHHQFIVSKDYYSYANSINDEKIISDDPSIYVRNSSITDPHVAPKGKSAVYILIPSINNRNNIDWSDKKDKYRNLILDKIEKKAGMKDLRKHILEEKVLTPNDWEKENIFMGATFSLKHNLMQMLYFRPHNKLKNIKNTYLVGGGTHPGSGLIPIYQSGRIAANMICKEYNIPFDVVDYHTEKL